MTASSKLQRHARRGLDTLRAGFTMVELMMIVAIVGLVVATVSVSFEAMVPSERLNTSVRNLAADLMSVRAEAITRNMPFRIEYNLDDERYRIETPFRVGGGRIITEDDPGEEEQRFRTSWRVMKTGVEIQSVVIAGEEYSAGTAFVRFDPLGTASDHTIILSQPRFGNTFSIEVMGLTGLVRMHDGVFFREAPDDGEFD